MASDASVEKRYEHAKEQYAALGVDTEAAMRRLKRVAISMHCWQGDDVGGFESAGELGGGLAVTGNYPGKARTPEELRSDLEMAFSLIPGRHRLNLHSLYGEHPKGKIVDRDKLGPEQFKGWVDWARSVKIGMDFNPSFFSHPKASDGFTLAHRDKGIREFWIRHGIACRKIGAFIGKSLGSPCVTNVWIPDGMKDSPVDRKGPRELLEKSLDKVFAEKINPKHNMDSSEGKL